MPEQAMFFTVFNMLPPAAHEADQYLPVIERSIAGHFSRAASLRQLSSLSTNPSHTRDLSSAALAEHATARKLSSFAALMSGDMNRFTDPSMTDQTPAHLPPLPFALRRLYADLHRSSGEFFRLSKQTDIPYLSDFFLEISFADRRNGRIINRMISDWLEF